MQLDQEQIVQFAEIIATSVVTALKKEGLIGNVPSNQTSATVKTEKNAYQKTEQLLYNYVGLKKIVADRMQEIEEIRKYGVPQSNDPFGERVQGGSLPGGIVLPEESVESAVQRIKKSVEDAVQAIVLIDKSMAALKYDPYYKVLEMRYFEGRTQEDIALEFKCVQSNISYHRTRLVKELAMRIFPNQVVTDIIGH